MENRLPASEIYRIQGEDIRRGIAEFKPNAPPDNFADSTRFDLLLDGHTRLPPKAVVGLAGQGPFGRILSPSEFSGGESSAAFRLLWDHGYEIATKRKKVGRFDATFSVGRGQDSLFLIVESRGPDRNTDYSEGLEALLWEMAHLSVTLADATVESSTTRHLPLDERRLHLASHTYPIRLAQVGDLGDLRADLMSTAAGTARTVESHGGGNPTKRIRLELKGAEEETLWELSEVLADGGGSQTPPVGTFNFQPGGTSGSSAMNTRRGIAPTQVSRVHQTIQESLYDFLVEEHGEVHVRWEHPAASGQRADIMVERGDLYDIYEIKTSSSPHRCIREALGQILEYAYWPEGPEVGTLWIVGPSEIDSTTETYLRSLRDRFNLPIFYQTARSVGK